jgi:hypothetical protein
VLDGDVLALDTETAPAEGVAAACKYTWSWRWSKGARVVALDGMLIPWEPAPG